MCSIIGYCGPVADLGAFQRGFGRTVSRGPDDSRVLRAGDGLLGFHRLSIMGLTPAAVTITGARKRFGSCSASNRICYSWRLMQYPEEAVDYVVVHELAHILHKNHGKAFYACVEEVLPDWRERRRLLRE